MKSTEDRQFKHQRPTLASLCLLVLRTSSDRPIALGPSSLFEKSPKKNGMSKGRAEKRSGFQRKLEKTVVTLLGMVFMVSSSLTALWLFGWTPASMWGVFYSIAIFGTFISGTAFFIALNAYLDMYLPGGLDVLTKNKTKESWFTYERKRGEALLIQGFLGIVGLTSLWLSGTLTASWHPFLLLALIPLLAIVATGFLHILRHGQSSCIGRVKIGSPSRGYGTVVSSSHPEIRSDDAKRREWEAWVKSREFHKRVYSGSSPYRRRRY